jgi:hypothetical protein
MEISYLGNNSVRIAGRAVTFVSDPQAGAGKKSSADVSLITAGTNDAAAGLVIDCPGEYEVKGTMVTGIPVGEGTAYVIQSEQIKIGLLTNATDQLSAEALEQLSELDALAIAAEGYEVIGKLEPKYVIPLGSGEALKKFLDELGASAVESQPKIKITGRDVPEETTVAVLDPSN